jgi:hypothetical protein
VLNETADLYRFFDEVEMAVTTKQGHPPAPAHRLVPSRRGMRLVGRRARRIFAGSRGRSRDMAGGRGSLAACSSSGAG